MIILDKPSNGEVRLDLVASLFPLNSFEYAIDGE